MPDARHFLAVGDFDPEALFRLRIHIASTICEAADEKHRSDGSALIVRFLRESEFFYP